MNKMSTLVLVAALGLAAPAFAQSPADLRSDPFLAKKETAVEMPAAPAKSEAPKAMPASKKHAGKHAKKAHGKHAKKAEEAASDAAPVAKKASKKDAK